MLNWDITYKMAFNTFYPVNLALIFEIPIKNQKHVYMKHNLESNLNTFITLLDTQKFIKAWRKSKKDDRFPKYHNGNEKVWRSDYKFHQAEHCFQHSENNPIPIAQEIRCYEQAKSKNIVFSDGVTRTIWLLANTAEYFPVSTRCFHDAVILPFLIGVFSRTNWPLVAVSHH